MDCSTPGLPVQPSPVFLPGKSHGQRSMAHHSPWGSQRVGHNWAINTVTFPYNLFYILFYKYFAHKVHAFCIIPLFYFLTWFINGVLHFLVSLYIWKLIFYLLICTVTISGFYCLCYFLNWFFQLYNHCVQRVIFFSSFSNYTSYFFVICLDLLEALEQY